MSENWETLSGNMDDNSFRWGQSDFFCGISSSPWLSKRPNEGADDGPAKKKAKYQKEVCYRMDGEVDHKNNSDEDPDEISR